MTYQIIPRTVIGLPSVVTSANGIPCPPLHNEPTITLHYTGVSSRDYATADVKAEVLRIQQVFGATKPFEYNYVIGQRNDDAVYEFAGTYQAAHSAGENSTSFGILFLNSVREPLNCVQIHKYQWIRDVLKYVGALQLNAQELPHNNMPGAKTLCPGTLVRRALPQLGTEPSVNRRRRAGNVQRQGFRDRHDDFAQTTPLNGSCVPRSDTRLRQTGRLPDAARGRRLASCHRPVTGFM